MKIFLMVLVLSISTLKAFAQDKGEMSINMVSIKDSRLIKFIEDFEAAKIANDSYFASGKGYLTLTLNRFLGKLPSGIKEIHYLNVNYSDFDAYDSMFPNYYAKTKDNRPILIFDDAFINLFSFRVSEESKKIFRGVIEPFLVKAETISDFGNDAGRFKVRLGSKVQLHGGIYLFITNEGAIQASDKF